MNIINDLDSLDKLSKDEVEEIAIRAQKRFDDYHNRKVNGQLTEQEKKGIENNKKLEDLIGEKGLENITSEDLRRLFRE